MQPCIRDTRREIRYSLFESIEYVGVSHDRGDYSIGITQDISTRGASVYIFDVLNEGDEITVRNKCGTKKAVTRWVRKLQDEIHIAGIVYLSDQPS